MIALDVSFQANIWRTPGKAGWHFVTLPPEIANEIKFFKETHTGFGTIPVMAQIGNTSWKTSIFPDKKSGSYLLPIKADVRKKEKIYAATDLDSPLKKTRITIRIKTITL